MRWDATLAVWREAPALVTSNPRALQWTADRVTEDLIALVRREMAHPLAGHEIRVADTHADFFVRGRVVVLAEVRALMLRHPTVFPRLVLFPRLERLTRFFRRLR